MCLSSLIVALAQTNWDLAGVLPPLYVVSLILGGGLLLLSIAFGGSSDTGMEGGSADFDMDGGGMEVSDGSPEVGGDVDADLAHDAQVGHGAAHGMSLATWFSLQFLIYFLAAFGLVGTTLTYASRVTTPMTLLIAVIGGVVVGQVVHQAIRALKRSGVGSDPTKEDYLNRVARVTIAIAPTRRGEVAVATRGGERYVAAAGKRRDEGFALGDRVVVVGFTNGVAEVVSRREYEFVTDSQPGGTT